MGTSKEVQTRSAFELNKKEQNKKHKEHQLMNCGCFLIAKFSIQIAHKTSARCLLDETWTMCSRRSFTGSIHLGADTGLRTEEQIRWDYLQLILD